MTRRIEHQGGKVKKQNAKDVRKQKDDAEQLAVGIFLVPFLAIMVFVLVNMLFKDAVGSELVVCGGLAILEVACRTQKKFFRCVVFWLVVVIAIIIGTLINNTPK
ncbi:MAG: hypothetical protein Q4B87_03455 [Candidatus Saccharibacteria bacterium]|nr:hypothetical protein [Candidatus Saccharibacteria bacterium]